MSISLYDALVPSWLQILHAVRGMLDKAESWSAEKGLTDGEILNARITDDMLPFSFQVASVFNHSYGAVAGVREGVFPLATPASQPATIADLKAMIDAASEGLSAVTVEEMESFVGRDMRFFLPEANLDLPFTAENYFFSFAQPNFYFHASTAYDILRGIGVELGKADFLGAVRIKAN